MNDLDWYSAHSLFNLAEVLSRETGRKFIALCSTPEDLETADLITGWLEDHGKLIDEGVDLHAYSRTAKGLICLVEASTGELRFYEMDERFSGKWENHMKSHGLTLWADQIVQ